MRNWTLLETEQQTPNNTPWSLCQRSWATAMLQVTDKRQSRQAVKEFQKHEQKFAWHTGLDKGQTKHLISIPPVATKNIKQTDKQINLPSELWPVQPKDPFLDYLGKMLPVDVNENRKWRRLASQSNRAQGIPITAFFSLSWKELQSLFSIISLFPRWGDSRLSGKKCLFLEHRIKQEKVTLTVASRRLFANQRAGDVLRELVHSYENAWQWLEAKAKKHQLAQHRDQGPRTERKVA